MKQLIKERQSPVCMILVVVMLTFNFCSASSVEISGELKQWHKVTLTFDGPETGEQNTINPFLNYRLDVTFSNGDQTIVVPGYYAADGNSGQTSAKEGSKWRCHFRPVTKGVWNWKASFRQGDNIALTESPDSGKSIAFDGATGSFEIIGSDKKAPDFRAHGLLQYTGEHYFQFAGSKKYFIKGGADSPENLLAYKEIDDTYDADAGSGSYEHIGGFIHEYKPHIADWKSGDPTWKDQQGKGLIGGLNYLASKEINSIYFLTYNMDGGDGRDVWMWTDEEERERFDCSKLDQWEIVFDHMEKLGLMMHVVTQETENDHNLGGSAGLNPVRKLYYRELIARYGHHLALIWNLGEENNTPDADRKEIASYMRSLDPYNHPITVHTQPNIAYKFYDDLLGNEYFEATSIQSDFPIYHKEAVDLRKRSAEAGRKWAIFGDEQGPASVGVMPDADDPTHDIPRKQGLWGNLMGGGAGVEWYFGHQYPHMDINCEDWRSRDIMWDQTRYALNFFNKYLPFWEMTPADQLTKMEDDYCFAKEGEVYAIFLPNGGTTGLDLSAAEGNFTVKWFNPREGGVLVNGSVKKVIGGAYVSIGTPPHEIDADWVCLVSKVGMPGDTYSQGDNKIVVIEMESAKIKSDWIESTEVEDYSGRGYYYYDGSNMGPGFDSVTFQYSFYLPERGTYKMVIRNYVPNDDFTLNNDSWIKMDHDRWWKHFSHTNWKWNWETGLDDGEENFYDPIWDLEAGFHKLQISGRSDQFFLDKIHIYDTTVHEHFALDPSLIASAFSDGNQAIISLSKGFLKYSFTEGEIPASSTEEVDLSNAGTNVLASIKAAVDSDLLVPLVIGEGNAQTLKISFSERVQTLEKGVYSYSIKLSCDNASDREMKIYLNID